MVHYAEHDCDLRMHFILIGRQFQSDWVNNEITNSHAHDPWVEDGTQYHSLAVIVSGKEIDCPGASLRSFSIFAIPIANRYPDMQCDGSRFPIVLKRSIPGGSE